MNIFLYLADVEIPHLLTQQSFEQMKFYRFVWVQNCQAFVEVDQH
jgi:hypothetical protein